MMITVRHKGNFNNFERFCNRVMNRNYLNILSEYADRGVKALQEATPVESGETASAWGYEIEDNNGVTTIYFTNSEEDNGVSVAVLLIYGHGTRNGGYVEGIDFVNPALRPIFRELADSIWREVTE